MDGHNQCFPLVFVSTVDPCPSKPPSEAAPQDVRTRHFVNLHVNVVRNSRKSDCALLNVVQTEQSCEPRC